LAIDIPDHIRFEVVEEDQLPTNWRRQTQLTQALGDRWLHDTRTALLRVPSAIVPFAVNWLLNPAHADAAHARIVEIIRTPFDRRLFGAE
jgi:RES domain-containing protein